MGQRLGPELGALLAEHVCHVLVAEPVVNAVAREQQHASGDDFESVDFGDGGDDALDSAQGGLLGLDVPDGPRDGKAAWPDPARPQLRVGRVRERELCLVDFPTVRLDPVPLLRTGGLVVRAHLGHLAPVDQDGAGVAHVGHVDRVVGDQGHQRAGPALFDRVVGLREL